MKQLTFVIMDSKLIPKQQRFCQEYVVDLNGTQAAIRAGYSPQSANEQASRMLAKANIKREVKRLQAAMTKKIGLTAEMVLNELRTLGFQNIQDFIDEGNQITDISKVAKKKAAAVSGIKTNKRTFTIGEQEIVETNTEIKMHSKTAALDMLSKHLGLFDADNNQRRENVVIRITNGKKQ